MPLPLHLRPTPLLDRVRVPEWALAEGWSLEAWDAFIVDCQADADHRSNDMADDWPSAEWLAGFDAGLDAAQWGVVPLA